jgi:hypothetical protein
MSPPGDKPGAPSARTPDLARRCYPTAQGLLIHPLMSADGIGGTGMKGYQIGVQLAPPKNSDPSKALSKEDFKVAQGLRQELRAQALQVRAKPMQAGNWPFESNGQYRIGKQLLVTVELGGGRGDFGARQALINPSKSEFFLKTGNAIVGPQPLHTKFGAQSYSDLLVMQLQSAANVGSRK